MKNSDTQNYSAWSAMVLVVAALINPQTTKPGIPQRSPGIRQKDFTMMNSKSSIETTPLKTCLCGRDFRVPWSFVVIQAPLLTIVGVCGDCSRKLRYGSFAERIGTASQLTRKATRREVA